MCFYLLSLHVYVQKCVKLWTKRRLIAGLANSQRTMEFDALLEYKARVDTELFVDGLSINVIWNLYLVSLEFVIGFGLSILLNIKLADYFRFAEIAKKVFKASIIQLLKQTLFKVE